MLGAGEHMNEPQPGAAAPEDRTRAVRFAYASLTYGLVGLIWMFIRNELGEPNPLLVVPCVIASVLAVVFGVKSLRRTQGGSRAAGILGLLVGSVGTGLGGLYLLLNMPFLLWAMLGSA